MEYFINIRVVEGQLQMQTNAPPGHYLSLIEAAKNSFIQNMMKQESAGGGIVVPPPGTKIR